MKKKFPIFVLLLMACLSCLVFAACKKDDTPQDEKELITLSSLQVMFGEEDITQNGKTITMTMLENVVDVVESKLKVNLIYSNEKVVEIRKNPQSGYKVTSTVPTNLIAGEYTYTISYGNLNSVVININVVKTYDKIEIANMDKSYDGQKIKKPTIKTLNTDEPIIKWFETNGEELEEAPVEVGEYYLQVTTLSTDEFFETTARKYFIISKAVPNFEIPTFDDTYYIGELNSLTQLSLPASFVWQDDQIIEPGENYYYATYTPEDTVHYNAVGNIGILVKTLQKVEKPTLSGTYTYTGEMQSATLENFDNGCFKLSQECDANNQINAGEYTLRVQIADKTKYCWQDKTNDDFDITWIIEKIDPSFEIPQLNKQTKKEVSTLEEVVLPSSFIWQEGQTLIEGTNIYLATFVPQDTTNYNTITDIQIEVVYYVHENLLTPEFELKNAILLASVDNASSYNVQIYKNEILNDEFNVEDVSINLLEYKDGTEYKLGIKVQALVDDVYYTNSEWSEMFECEFEKLAAPVIIQGTNSVSWQAVENAVGYAYKINDGEEQIFSGRELVLNLQPTDKVVVKALSTNTLFVDSDWSNEITLPKQIVEIPTITNNNVTLEGTSIKVAISGYNSTYMIYSFGTSDDQVQYSAGTYHFVFKLKDTSKYTWADGTTEDKVLEWVVL